MQRPETPRRPRSGAIYLAGVFGVLLLPADPGAEDHETRVVGHDCGDSRVPLPVFRALLVETPVELSDRCLDGRDGARLGPHEPGRVDIHHLCIDVSRMDIRERATVT